MSTTAIAAVPAHVADLSYAHGGPLGAGRIRERPEDFVVREQLGFEPSGEGEHILLTVRKRGANTKWVARQIAAHAGVRARDVGFSGLKDRHAITEQSFTVPAVGRTPESWYGVGDEEFAVIAAARQRRKLRRGAHRANEFAIVVRGFAADSARLAEVLSRIASHGVPNYFGGQRFGHDEANLQTAEQWLCRGIAPADRDSRSFALSAARAALFNAVTTARVRDGSWNRILEGEVINLNGTGSIFTAAVDAELRDRCIALDVHPTGPLCGEGESRVQSEALLIEEQALAPWLAWRQGLQNLHVQQQRRSLRVAVQDLRWDLAEGVLQLRFRLARGAFATAVLREIVSFTGAVPAQLD